MSQLRFLLSFRLTSPLFVRVVVGQVREVWDGQVVRSQVPRNARDLL